MHDQVAEVGAEAVGAAEQLAVVHDAEAEAVLDADDEEIVEAAAWPNQCSARVTRLTSLSSGHRHAEARRQLGAEGHVALAEDRALPAAAGGALDDAGKPDADAAHRRDRKPGIGNRTAHAVLDEIGR